MSRSFSTISANANSSSFFSKIVGRCANAFKARTTVHSSFSLSPVILLSPADLFPFSSSFISHSFRPQQHHSRSLSLPPLSDLSLQLPRSAAQPTHSTRASLPLLPSPTSPFARCCRLPSPFLQSPTLFVALLSRLVAAGIPAQSNVGRLSQSSLDDLTEYTNSQSHERFILKGYKCKKREKLQVGWPKKLDYGVNWLTNVPFGSEVPAAVRVINLGSRLPEVEVVRANLKKIEQGFQNKTSSLPIVSASSSASSSSASLLSSSCPSPALSSCSSFESTSPSPAPSSCSSFESDFESSASPRSDSPSSCSPSLPTSSPAPDLSGISSEELEDSSNWGDDEMDSDNEDSDDF